ncbi:5'-nucleotidase C-terminal domain-containing protein [Nocardioides sp. GY 10127]|uniref:5'-nucleotidase C-terminal domain-containing protein n=1 Tax=Nocardioides sp. GY 10127 TaxID=2569762 RepID=UPI0010A78A12|nr:5'-nucleotidase C-terminal domain-containing protein [Nocardioides sp. GY 10127]TIC85569.1 hypothetical protein E8D37_02795 [Nocardioides sp. GY 10127]
MHAARSRLAGAVSLALLATGVAVAGSGSAHAEPVTAAADGDIAINLLGVNDFHGRIFTNTVKWAGTVEKLRAEGGDADTLFVGAGDLVGASLFASAVDDDQPTIDVLNALGLDASAVGNHEFDKGFDDLTDRIIGADGSRNAQWDYLGANVYEKGTTTPALPEYATFDVEGVSVAVVGAVTEETASLVSPGGISDIEFGDPVEAVNRVAGELSDGDEANGEADVIVATFHAGAQDGTETYEDGVAHGGEFAEMADLDPAVDVIFNGHTHQTYVYDQPIPGESGTRPLLQTGSYAANVGHVVLSVDPTTHEVTGYEAENVATSSTTETDAELAAEYPDVAQVKSIVDDALADAAEVGNEPVGAITDDVTTAFADAAPVDGEYEGTTRDNRQAESTLGDLVANALRDGIPSDMGEADLGITNPGGLRAELLYAGDTTDNPENTDGVVTYAEANSVLPFVNNIWLVDLTGAELKDVLEQQWQPSGADRPYLQLGLSDNVEVTADSSADEGSRITSVRIDGEPVDPDATYTVSTFSFLGTGGDNFTAFTEGTSSDTGLVDRDLWISYLQDASPISPSYSRQQVFATDLPSSVSAGSEESFTLGTDNVTPAVPTTGETLDLTSLGSPVNTKVKATLVRDGETVGSAGTFAVTDGTADIDLTTPCSARAGDSLVLTAKPSGTQVTLPVVAADSLCSEVSATVLNAGKALVNGNKQLRLEAVVDAGDGTPTGTVTATVDGTEVDSAELGEDGTALLVVPAFSLAGSQDVVVTYSGDDTVEGSSTTVAVRVRKAPGKIAVSRTPAAVHARTTRPTWDVSVAAPGTSTVPSGRVVVRTAGFAFTAVLHDGEASLRLPAYGTVGVKNVRISYLGDDEVTAATVLRTVRVVH